MRRAFRRMSTTVSPSSRSISLDFERQGEGKDVVIYGDQGPTTEDNRIKTTHYTLLNFVFLNAYKQFHRAANVYFLLIMILQMWIEVSITQGEPSMLMPLAFVLLVTAVKDALEDYSRYCYDVSENNKTTKVVTKIDPKTGEPIVSETIWAKLKVGSIVRLENREMVPADIVLLACSDDVNGIVHVMTAGLDGETNLKQRQIHTDIPKDLRKLDRKASIQCESPTKILDSFNATITMSEDKQTEPTLVSLSSSNIILRGSQVRNSEWLVGVVVYAGTDTKLQLNASTASFKTSSSMGLAQKLMYYVFALQCIFCILAAFVSASMLTRSAGLYYLQPDEDVFYEEFVLRFFNYMIIFTNFIPISLLVTIDMVKFGQGFLVAWDLNMYHEETDRRTKVNCSELNEELGCIEHIFSDKTGTLTANVMKFKACSCNENMIRVPEDSLRVVNPDEPDAEHLQKLFVSLSLNHAVIPEILSSGESVYSASSPDEGALIHAAIDNGHKLKARGMNSLVIEKENLKTGETEDVTYTILNMFDFSSDRKRSSIIVRDNRDNKIQLHCKGADNVMLQRLSAEEQASYRTKTTLAHLDDFAMEGLRTLCIAHRTLTEEYYTEWAKRYHAATVQLEGRFAAMSALQDEIEVELELLGCTAIEDKLQEEVAETIYAFRQAGLKVWMLTGDKVDTAVNIGFSCALWTYDMELIYIVFDEKDCTKITEEQLNEKLGEVGRRIKKLPAEKKLALVMDTNGVYALTTFNKMDSFLEIADRCESVICARVSPDQKAVIIKCVRDSDPRIKTLAIGDGANDVPMIQTAHVGVGIYGEEGLQAANAADFSIARFKFLKRLLFVHGRWSARRVGILVCYMFYKNAILVLPQFFYAFFCLASGQAFYLDYPLYQGYNLAFTSLPIIVFGVFDRDVSAETTMDNPVLYREGSLRPEKAKYFSTKRFWEWIIEGSTQAVLITVIILSVIEKPGGITSQDGHSHDIWMVGTVINLSVCLVVTFRLFIENKSVNWIMVGAYVFSFLLWFGTLILWSETETIPSFFQSSKTALGSINYLYENMFITATTLAVATALLPSFAFVSYRTCFCPSPSEYLRERELTNSTSAKHDSSVHPEV